MTPPDWDARYAGDDYVFGTEPNEFLRDEAARIPPGRVLCLGEGEGRNGVFLAGRGHHVTAVDLSPVGLAKARALAAARGVADRYETIATDLATWEPPRDAFAGVVSIFCHLEPELRPQVHARAAAALAPGGVIVLESYSPAQLAHKTGGPKDLALLYTAELLRRDFASLEIVIARELERVVVEGPRHTGLAAVTQLVARRPA